MRGEVHRPERRAQGQEEDRRSGVPGVDMVAHESVAAARRGSPAMPPLRAALSAALRQRVRQRAVREQGALPCLVGHICEQCWEASALLVQPAPWGGEMGVCEACQQETPTGDKDL